jgi:hypothetical protein
LPSPHGGIGKHRAKVRVSLDLQTMLPMPKVDTPRKQVSPVLVYPSEQFLLQRPPALKYPAGQVMALMPKVETPRPQVSPVFV